jgi:hypothetical protein
MPLFSIFKRCTPSTTVEQITVPVIKYCESLANRRNILFMLGMLQVLVVVGHGTKYEYPLYSMVRCHQSPLTVVLLLLLTQYSHE